MAQDCPSPQREYCDASRGTTEFQNCQVRNRQEDNRHQECLAAERRERERERKEKEREEQEKRREQQEKKHEQFCEVHPDMPGCK